MVRKYSLLFVILLGSIASQHASAELFNTKHNKQASPVSKKVEGNTSNRSSSTRAHKSLGKSMPNLTQVVVSHMKNISSSCLGSWETQICLKELSSVSMSMATNYAERLDASNNKPSMEPLKQHCAASTAAIKIEVPAYAMKSAITECVNTVSDINDKTSISPNINLYQILVGSVLCLGKDISCNDFEAQLSKFK